MMRDEGFSEDGQPNNNQQGTSTMWGMVGAVSGGALGFIVGNVPGLLAGAVAGNRLGAIRDTKGKSVYEVFQVRHWLRTLCATASQITLRLTYFFRFL